MSESKRYRQQHRGDRGAYQRYLRGMDASMRQKVALTAAHILAEGTIADMGMGSGTGSHALAALYPGLDVIGVDVEPTMVEMARERFDLPNLRFVVGDISNTVFENDTIDAIINSSVLHHVTSFGGYRDDLAGETLATQRQQLRGGGVLIVRDFLAPTAGTVLLDLPTDDGDESDDPQRCSTAHLFERFAREYRSLCPTPGFEYQVMSPESGSAHGPAGLPPPKTGWRRYRLSRRLAAEFLLRKDYRRDWVKEVQEAYTYYRQDEFEACYARLGLRVLVSTPIWNPWIVRNRFLGKFQLRGEGGEHEEPPATNYLIVGERVGDGEGLRFRVDDDVVTRGFLSMHHFRHVRTGQIMDLVRRPHRTLDILPFFEDDGDLFVLARGSYPRPLSQLPRGEAPALTGARSAGYVVEPLVVVQGDGAVGSTIENTLLSDAGIEAAAVVQMMEGSTFYPSPGGIEEEVQSTFVEIEPVFATTPLANRTGLSTAGRILVMEMRQLLRSAQVGGLPDARLELGVYDLLHQRDLYLGPWIGEEIELEDGEAFATTSLDELLARRRRRVFERHDTGARFLVHQAARFVEEDADAKEIAAVELEYVLPRSLSHQTIATALLRRHGDVITIGLDDDDLPAAQSLSGNSDLLVTPAWRLPAPCQSITPAMDWIQERLAEEYGLGARTWWELGGRYAPSLGLTPETVYPMAIDVTVVGDGRRSLHWVPLSEVLAGRRSLFDGHLRIVSARAAHALGVTRRSPETTTARTHEAR